MTTRTELQRVATHVLARKRFAATGRFGLRTGPRGVATPMFGTEVLRTSGAWLVHEQAGDSRSLLLDGATLDDVARWAGVDLDVELSVGADTPALDRSRPLALDDAEAADLAGWLHEGWGLLDRVCAGATEAAAVQLWPEHFDAGCSVATPSGRCNLGVSPGDSFSEEPYLYVGPWEPPAPDSFWNAPFGAVLRRSEVDGDPLAWLQEGLDRLR